MSPFAVNLSARTRQSNRRVGMDGARCARRTCRNGAKRMNGAARAPIDMPSSHLPYSHISGESDDVPGPQERDCDLLVTHDSRVTTHKSRVTSPPALCPFESKQPATAAPRTMNGLSAGTTLVACPHACKVRIRALCATTSSFAPEDHFHGAWATYGPLLGPRTVLAHGVSGAIIAPQLPSPTRLEPIPMSP